MVIEADELRDLLCRMDEGAERYQTWVGLLMHLSSGLHGPGVPALLQPLMALTGNAPLAWAWLIDWAQTALDHPLGPAAQRHLARALAHARPTQAALAELAQVQLRF